MSAYLNVRVHPSGIEGDRGNRSGPANDCSVAEAEATAMARTGDAAAVEVSEMQGATSVGAGCDDAVGTGVVERHHDGYVACVADHRCRADRVVRGHRHPSVGDVGVGRR